MNQIKIAIVHDWLVDYSGSERVVEQIINIFPNAELFSIVEFLPENLKWFIKNKSVKTSFIQKLPFAKRKYRNYLPLMPLAIEQLDVSAYDIVISSSHAISKGVITHSEQLHICYCHSPIRYGWDLYHEYLSESKLSKGVKGFFAQLVLHYIRQWDLSTSNRIDYFISNSKYISRRIQKVYRRDSDVIYPPVKVNDFDLVIQKDDFYLTASRMVPYKKISLIVDTFTNHLKDKKLIVIGDGPDYDKIKSLAGPNVTLLGYQKFEILKDHLQRAKAFVFAANEDFGIIPVEAQACGTPVIAFGGGANFETVKENATGIYFDIQTIDSLKSAIIRFESMEFDYRAIREHSERFSVENFVINFKQFVNEKYKEKFGKELEFKEN
jgi:glycosyltransferase involved in cell wall biosynthesis